MVQRTLFAAALAVALAAPAATFAQDDEVLATVNGEAITEGDVAFATETLGDTVNRIAPEERQETILNLLIDMNLLAGAAEAQGLADGAEFAERVEWIRRQTLRDLYMEDVIERTVTDEAVQARYEEEAAKVGPREEVSARHILVPDREQAVQLIAQLQGGADFATLATENSQDPGSAQRGGDLGFFGRGQMVPPFEAAAFALEPGQVTPEPVESQFGWHVIRVDEKREQPLPTLEQVGDQIRQIMTREAFVAEVERLRGEAAIERTAAAAPAETPAAPTPEAPAAQ